MQKLRFDWTVTNVKLFVNYNTLVIKVDGMSLNQIY